MDFGVLLWVSPTVWSSFTEHATNTEEQGSFLVSYPILDAWCTRHYELYKCPQAVSCIRLCRVIPVNQWNAKHAAVCSHLFLYQLWVRTKERPMSREQRWVTSWRLLPTSSKEAAAQNGSGLRKPILQKHSIIFGCPQLPQRGTELVEAGV